MNKYQSKNQISTHTHTHTHTHAHTHTHTHTHTNTHTYIHTYIHTYTQIKPYIHELLYDTHYIQPLRFQCNQFYSYTCHSLLQNTRRWRPHRFLWRWQCQLCSYRLSCCLRQLLRIYHSDKMGSGSKDYAQVTGFF